MNSLKTEKAEILIDEVAKKFPNLRDCIEAYYTSTPLSYRDYIGSHRGSMYAYVKDVNKTSAFASFTKNQNQKLIFYWSKPKYAWHFRCNHKRYYYMF